MRGSITGTAIVVDNLVTIDPRIWYSHHGHAPYRITGTVKNSVGAAIGGAKLLLFQSTGHNSKFGTEAANGPGQGVNDALQATVSTGAGDAQTLGGYGFVVLDNTTPHYIVAESSDGTLVGTTVKTLVGS